MEIVFLLIYLVLYWAIRINQTLTPDDLALNDERLGLLFIMFLTAIPVVFLWVIIGSWFYRMKFRSVSPSIDSKKLMKHNVAYSALCSAVVAVIYFSKRDYFDASFGEFGVSMFIFWFVTILFGSLRLLPAAKNGY